MSDFTRDFDWQARFAPMVFGIVRKLPVELFTEVQVAPRWKDLRRNADAVVMPVGGKDVAMRLRRPGYMRLYGLEITMRTLRTSGAETELAKVQRGLGDWFFYGHIEREWHPDDRARSAPLDFD